MVSIEDADVSELVGAIIRKLGPDLEGNVPSPIYDLIRRYNAMYSVDGVPVLTDEPSVVLVKRTMAESYPGMWWMVGGRVPKRVFDERGALHERMETELGVESRVLQRDIVGIGRLETLSPLASLPHSLGDYIVDTPTLVYAVRIGKYGDIAKKLNAGDGNELWQRFTGEELLHATTMHPYVRSACLVALDHVHGNEWRLPFSEGLYDDGYPTCEEYELSTFIPLHLRRQPE